MLYVNSFFTKSRSFFSFIDTSVFIKQISLFIFSIQNFNKLYKKDVKVIVILVFILKTLSNHTQSALRIGLQIKYLIKIFFILRIQILV